MKNLLRIIGGLLIVFAVVIFMYGSIKTSRAIEDGEKTVQITEGIELVEENRNEEKAKDSFMIGGVSLAFGLLFFFLAKGRQ